MSSLLCVVSLTALCYGQNLLFYLSYYLKVVSKTRTGVGDNHRKEVAHTTWYKRFNCYIITQWLLVLIDIGMQSTNHRYPRLVCGLAIPLCPGKHCSTVPYSISTFCACTNTASVRWNHLEGTFWQDWMGCHLRCVCICVCRHTTGMFSHIPGALHIKHKMETKTEGTQI